MGSPEFALPVLRALVEHYQVVGVVTQPDQPAGRGQQLRPPPVKITAEELNIPFIQPARLRDAWAMEQLKQWNPECIVVAAFGQILKPEVLELPPYGCVNVHASLLPRWRGASPIQAAIFHGDAVTGVTIVRMDPGLDTGPILSQRSLPIASQDTAATLGAKLSLLGADLLIETLPGYFNGTIYPQEQDSSSATYIKMLKKEDGRLDFTRTAVELERQVRAYTPWPGSFFPWQGQPLKVTRAHVEVSTCCAPGVCGINGKLPQVGTALGSLVLDEVQPAGKKPMPGEVFLRGARTWEGTQIPTN